MRTLVYLRTHSGDPDKGGIFGIHDCMGQVRSRYFEAVIGVGGRSAEARSWGISGKVTWIGIGPQKHDGSHKAPVVTFDHFLYFGEDGLDFRVVRKLRWTMPGNSMNSPGLTTFASRTQKC